MGTQHLWHLSRLLLVYLLLVAQHHPLFQSAPKFAAGVAAELLAIQS